MASREERSKSFSIMDGAGNVYFLQRVTEILETNMGGQVFEEEGKSWYETDDGRGVNENTDGTFSIPSLGVTGNR